ncbi:MAG: DUF2357 domain-containing protein [Desulfobacterales bacterium]|nr:DUF2357 domain-containing protein [Desulfobacterales bacterium]
MTILFYDKKSQIAISSEPFFENEEGSIEPVYSYNETVPLAEWKPYYIKFYGDKIAHFEQAPFFVRPLGDLKSYEINFKNYVGLTRIGDINLRVENRKIGDELYDSMLDYITGKYADLIFSFNTSVGLEYKKGEVGKDILYIQYLFLKKYLLDTTPNLDEITGLILSSPHRKLTTEVQKCRIDEIDHFDVSLVLALFSDTGKMGMLGKGHPLLSSPLGQSIYKRTGKSYYPWEAKKIRKYHTFDTNENRFIKHFLRDISKMLDLFEQTLGYRSGTYLNPSISSNIRDLKQKVRYLFSNPIWDDVGQMTFIPSQSTVLQRKDGYRHLFRLYSLMQLVTRYQFLMEDFKNLIEVKDVPTLFEYWCFFLVKDILEKKFKTLEYSIIISPADTEQKVQEGIQIFYEGDVSLLYNRSYGGSLGVGASHSKLQKYQTKESYSHDLRPDIVITKNSNTKLVLDAKYKGKKDGGGFYGEETEGSIIRWKEEDVDKMHTYRDALKDVFGSFALYPGKEPVVYPSHKAGRRFEGVGALPLKPVPGGKPEPKHLAVLQEAIDDFLGAQ